MKIFHRVIGFDWDKGNINKNLKHHVTNQEAEEVFYDVRKKIVKKISEKNEKRWIIMGSTKTQRMLFVVYTIRKNKIRVISARDLNKKERLLYA